MLEELSRQPGTAGPPQRRAGLLAGVAFGTVAVAGFATHRLGLWGQAPPRPGGELVGRVELAASPGATAPSDQAVLVVYAYALDGPRQPLAVLRRPAASLPLDFKLDDTLAPNPAFRLSQAPQLVVGARLGTGDAATAQPGDWVAPAQKVPLGTHGVRLVLQPPVAAATTAAATAAAKASAPPR